jgi:hypothetical protein
MSEIVNKLFGVTTDSYQQAQQDSADARALQYAKLSPIEKASYGAGRGGYALGGAIGGALGGQDPELQRITRRQQIAGQIDFTNPESIRNGMTMLRDDPQGMQQLAQIFRQQQESGALVNQRDAAARASMAQANRERIQASPKEVQLAREVALLSGPEGSIEYNTAYAKSLEDQMKPKEPRGLAFGTDREAVAAELYDKSFSQLTPTERAKVNKRVEDEQGKKAKAGATVVTVPGVKGVGDVVKLRNDINTTLKPYRDAVNAADQAIALADDVLLTGNFASAASLARSLAKASGETQLSKADVTAFGGDPSLVGSVSDIASRLATGTPTADTTRKLKGLAVLLKKKNESLEKNEIKQLQKTAELSKLYSDEQIKELFTLRGETKGTTRKTAGGVSYTVED